MFSAQPSKGPEEATEERALVAAEDEAPAKAAGEAEGTESGKRGRKNSATPSGAESTESDAEREAPAANSKWTSNVGQWLTAWKGGGQMEVRQLDSMAKMGDNGVIMQGKLFKRGEKAGDAFRPRWITLNKKCVTYSVDETSPAIDHISFQDIVAMCYHKPRLDPSAAAADDDTITQLDATAPADGEHVVVQEIADVTKVYKEHAKKLHVNIIFRDKVSETMMEHVETEGLELGQGEFCLVTALQAYQRGRIFVFRAESRERAEVWQETISRVIACYANVPVEPCSTLSMLRRKVHWFYMGDRCQVTVAVLILSNFILNIFEAHFTPEEGSSMQALFAQIDMGFTIIFTIELLTNMFATLVYEFVKDSWNWFDTMVVSISLCTLFLENLPGAKPLKLMRCFRVFRLFKRIPSLRQIIVALTASVPPMINAFALVCLVTAIYAIVGVTLFASKSPENFFDFFTAMFTMFQVMTGDNWSDICRNLFVSTGQGAGVAMFFVSFQLIVALVLVNVVIAVLLDEFSKAAERRESSGGGLEEDVGQKCPFEKIARYLSEYKDLDDLESMINDLYDRVLSKSKLRQKMGGGLEIHGEMTPEAIRRTLRAYFKCWRSGEPLEGECDGNVTFIEFRAGIKALGFIPPIIVTRRIWEAYVLAEASALKLNTETELLSRRGFMALMKLALKRFQLKCLTVAMEGDPDGWNKNGIIAALMGVKGLLVEDLELAKGGLTVMNDKKHNQLPDEFEAKDDAERAATELLLKRLVMDMHKMHKRFDAVESELAAVSDARNRITKAAAPLVPSGPGAPPLEGNAREDVTLPPRQSPQKSVHRAQNSKCTRALTFQNTPPRTRTGTPPRTRTGGDEGINNFTKKKEAQGKAFVGKMAEARRVATSAPIVSDVTEAAGGGQLTTRGKDGAAAPGFGAGGWGLGALSTFADATKTPLAPPDPSKLFSQGNNAANNLMGGFMGGLSTLGSSVTNAVPQMPQGNEAANNFMAGWSAMGSSVSNAFPQMPQMPAMPTIPEFPTLPTMTPLPAKAASQ